MKLSFPPIECRTLVDLLRARASHQPEQRAYTFLTDGESDERHLTYAELDRKARGIGTLLQENGGSGKPVLLLYPPGLDFIAAFLGTMYGGAIAIPTYPPHPARPERNLPRIRAIVKDAQPEVVLTTTAICSIVDELAVKAPELQSLRWLHTDFLPEDAGDSWTPPVTDGEALALLQYTSGSTAAPKGVMVSHGNLLHNSLIICKSFDHSAESTGVIWLPPYHDMGLIGGVLQPLYAGFPVVLFSPVAFLEKPLRWLRAITRYHGTTSGGPNFAYGLCVRKVKAEEKQELDLSSWSVAFDGAEPVHARTLEEFSSAFASCGFRNEALYPCYGLAEGTLMVSGGAKSAPPAMRQFASTALLRHEVVEAPRFPAVTDGIQTLVGCGRSLLDQNLVIVDPETLTPCPPDRIGEIWVSGPSVAQGYWKRAEESDQSFRAYLRPTNEGPFLRTGDLGFIRDEELFVTGRAKDVIIIRGLNHYPQDIEQTVEECHPALRQYCTAAFPLDVKQEERLIVVAELERHQRRVDADEVFNAVRRAVAARHEIDPYAVTLVKAGTLPKTPSGKIQRGLCRTRYLEGELDVVGEWMQRFSESIPSGEAASTEKGTSGAGSDLLRRLQCVSLAEREELLMEHLKKQAASMLDLHLSSPLDLDRALNELGLNSMMAVEIATDLATTLGRQLPETLLLEHQTIRSLARFLATQVPEASSAELPAR